MPVQGGGFIEQHVETPEIQTAHVRTSVLAGEVCASLGSWQINWNYKATNEVVLVEVWDVVDKGERAQHRLVRSSLCGCARHR